MTLPASTAATRLFGCRLPIILAGMGGVARSGLVGAVTAAGGFGFLGMVREPVALIRREVEALRRAGHDNFGVNIIPASTPPDLLEQQVATLIDLRVPAVALFWDIDAALVARFRAAGIIVAYQVGTADEAVTAAQAGASLIIAQGVEAGGHVRGTVPLRDLLPAVVEAVDVPVLAAGGLATGGDLLTALALGADGIVLGTALMATTESFAHDAHKRHLAAATGADTILTDMFHLNWPRGANVRVLKSAVTAGARGTPDAAPRTVIGDEEGRPIYLFSTDSPLRSMTGDFDAMALYAGTGVGQIREIVPAAARLAAIMSDAVALLAATSAADIPSSASAVCYAGEMSGDYMGTLDAAETATLVATVEAGLAGLLRATLAASKDATPFTGSAHALAAWCLALRDMAGAAPRPAAPPADLAALVSALSQAIPRLPEGAMRERLSQLRRVLDERLLRAIVAAPRFAVGAE